jgi:3D-(3,5/4)-trihydroxycyclohexane-1,2-dione acylhydrolase (decyclizing)
MVGDGSYLMLSAELTTSVQEGRRLTVVLLDNHGFQCIKNLSGDCGGHNEFNSFRFRDPATGELSGSNLPIDFAANAASLGAHVLRADSAAELAAALRDARGADRTTVIVVEVDPSVAVPDYGSWWDVPVAEVSTSESVREARRAYDKHVTTERRFV